MLIIRLPITPPDIITTCCGTRNIIEVPNETASDTVHLCGKCGDVAYAVDVNQLQGIRQSMSYVEKIIEEVKEELLAEEKYEELQSELAAHERFKKNSERVLSLIEKALKDPSV